MDPSLFLALLFAVAGAKEHVHAAPRVAVEMVGACEVVLAPVSVPVIQQPVSVVGKTRGDSK